MNIIIKYGWICLLIAIVGVMIVPFVLAPFYKGYSHTTLVISSLGNSNSPVRVPFNLWMLTAGILLSTPSDTLFQFRGWCVWNNFDSFFCISVDMFCAVYNGR